MQRRLLDNVVRGGLAFMGLAAASFPGPGKLAGIIVVFVGVAALIAGYFITHGAGCYIHIPTTY